MKKTIIFLLMIMMVAAGCSQPGTEAETYTCPDGTEVADASECDLPDEPTPPEQQVETPPAPEPQEEVEAEGVDPEVEDLITTAEEKVNSFSYVYVGPPQNLPRDTFLVKGNKIAVVLHKDTHYKLTQPYTHAYLDTEAMTAAGYCNVKDISRCPNGIERYGEVEWEEHYIRTPYQWLKEMETAELQGNGPQYESRATKKVRFSTGDESGIMYIVDFFELPGKIILDNGETIEFRDLSVNSVKDEEVLPPK